MGSKVSKVTVTAPKTLTGGKDFEARAHGVLFVGLKVPKRGVKKGETVEVEVPDEDLTIRVTAPEAMEAGQDFEVGDDKYRYVIRAPEGGIKKGEVIDVAYKDVVYRGKTDYKLTYVRGEEEGMEGEGREIFFDKNEGQIEIPSKDLTGVDTHIIEICANLSSQIYNASSKKLLKLEASTKEKARVIIFDNHGDCEKVLPTFSVAVTDDTMIVGWRGSHEISDFVTDAVLAPVVCNVLGKAASGIRVQAMMASLAGSDLEVYGSKMVNYIKQNGIKQIVFTGHSLGGGIASVAHLFVQAQIDGYQSHSIWEDVPSDISVKSMVFAAVMSVLARDEVKGENEHSDNLLAKVGENSVNFVYGPDVVPRGYAHVGYIDEVLKEVATEDISEYVPGYLRGPASWWLQNKAESYVKDITKFSNTEFVPVAKKYRHVGKLLHYYKDDEGHHQGPLQLVDTGPEKSTSEDDFSYYSYSFYPESKADGNNIVALLEAHSYFPKAFVSYLSIERKDLGDKFKESAKIAEDQFDQKKRKREEA